ncbi:MAG: NUDIX hydrolase [Clostridiales bacterium]|nr:NUDIX hydrolase [Eubacterium sp.]MDD7350478.1 NUDIX hydrolase [Clostridiales bacterium]
MEKFEILGKELAYQGRIIDFYKLKLRTPSGHEVQWDHIEHKGASAVLPIDDQGKVLTVMQYRGAIDDIMIEIPAGGRDSVEEDFAVCAARELEEETGFRANRLEHLVDIHTAAAYTSEKIAIYVAKDLIPTKQNLDEDEFVSIQRYSFEELNEMIFSGKITDSKTIAAVMAYQTQQQNKK